MVDIHEDVGYLTVTLSGVTVYADGDDAGSQPNAQPIAATVKVEPAGLQRDPIAELPTGDVLIELGAITAYIDAAGELVSAQDGRGDAASISGNRLRLVAPDQPVLDLGGWTWKITLTLAATGRVYVIHIGGPPDTTRDISTEIKAGNYVAYPGGSVPNAIAFAVDVPEVDGVYGPDTQAAVVAASLDWFDEAARPVPEAWVALNTANNTLYPIGADL